MSRNHLRYASKSFSGLLDQMFVRKSLLHGVTTIDRAASVSPQRKRYSLLARILKSPLMETLIVLNAAQMGLSLELIGSPWDSIWRVFDIVVASCFFLEMVFRLHLLRRSYFKHWLNVIDFAVAWLGVADVLLLYAAQQAQDNSSLSALQLLRLLRLLRFARLLHVFPSVIPMLESMFASLKAMSVLFALVLFVIYVSAIPCVMLIGNRDAGYPGYNDNLDAIKAADTQNFNNYRYFGSVTSSMITLFHLSMLSDEMVEVIRATALVQKWPVFFFIAFILLMTLCLLNTILGVIVEKTVVSVLHGDKSMEAQMRKKKMDALDNLSELMQEFDDDGDGEISLEEMKKAIRDPRLRQVLGEISLPVGFTVEELFLVLDSDGNGFINYHEFTGGLFRMVYSNDFQRECMLRLELAQIKKGILNSGHQVIEEVRSESSKVIHEFRSMIRAQHATCNIAAVGVDHAEVDVPNAGGSTASCCHQYSDSENNELLLQSGHHVLHQWMEVPAARPIVEDSSYLDAMHDALQAVRAADDDSDALQSAQTSAHLARTSHDGHSCNTASVNREGGECENTNEKCPAVVSDQVPCGECETSSCTSIPGAGQASSGLSSCRHTEDVVKL